jgi:hypothetical protein
MKEIAVFEAWTDRMMEGTWELPETPEQLNQLRQLLSQPLTVGVDAMDATEQLGGLVGDDELFDRLTDLADHDPNANAWDDSAVMDRMWELADASPELAAALTQIGTPTGPEDDQPGMAEDLGDLRPKLGSRRDWGKSIRKWRKARGMDESGVAEDSLNEFSKGEEGFGPFKIYSEKHFIDQFKTFDEAMEEVEFLRDSDPKSFNHNWRIVDGTGDTVWEYDIGDAIDAQRRKHKIQFNNPGRSSGLAEDSLNELSTDLLQKAAQVAKDKSNQAMDPEIHRTLGGGYKNPLARHYDSLSQKFGRGAEKAKQRDTVKTIASIASPAVMRKIGIAEQGVAESASFDLELSRLRELLGR